MSPPMETPSPETGTAVPFESSAAFAGTYEFTNNTIVDDTAGFLLQEGATGNTITGNTVTAPTLLVGDDGGNTIRDNTLNAP